MSYLGEIPLNGFVTWQVDTHDPTNDGAESDADAVPSFRIYEEGVDAALINGNLAKQDDANTVGFYSGFEQIQAGDGFEVGKYYTIRTRGVVSTVPGNREHTFKCIAPGEVKIDINKNGTELEIIAWIEKDGVVLTPTSAVIDVFAASDMATKILDAQSMGAVAGNRFRYLWDPATAVVNIEYIIDVTITQNTVPVPRRAAYHIK